MTYPTLFLENQFGEKSNNVILGGSGKIDCNFIVDSTNGNGLGIRSLKGDSVESLYMHTSATPAVGSPNPAIGYIYVKLKKAYTDYVSGGFGFVSPVSGTPINVTTGTTAGLAYVITSLGTTSAAQWQVLGVPANVTPAVGVAFIAIATTTATGTGTIMVPATSGSTVYHIEAIGNPGLASGNDGHGTYLVFRILGATSSSDTTLVNKAPANETVIGLTFSMDAPIGEF